MIYLDTHVVVWLYMGEVERLSPTARQAINTDDIAISPMVLLELQYLHEIGRTTESGDTVFSALSPRIGLQVSEERFPQVVSLAMPLTWTRDPFDRIIVGHAALRQSPLVTKDNEIRTHYPQALW